MKVYLFCAILVLISLSPHTSATEHNLNFEHLEEETPTGWSYANRAGYEIIYDKTISNSGHVSGSIKSIAEKVEYQSIQYAIPANFTGKTIKLTGYLKTKNVEGFAGLWMRVDPRIGFDNMAAQQIKGNHDWTKYEIEYDYKDAAQSIVVGGLLVGSGQIWIDDLVITIDGRPLSEVPEKVLPQAFQDKEFDSGSQIHIKNLNAGTIDNLVMLGRVWGFLKYHHPKIASGDVNWDYELFRVLPSYLEVNSTKERDALLLTWIDKLGEIKACNECRSADKDAFLKPNHDWMTGGVSKALGDKLQDILVNRHQGPQHYIEIAQSVGNPIFKNESGYDHMTYPDDGFRLLAVYRFWNMVNYFFPYKHLTDQEWDSVLPEHIQTFVSAKDELAYEIAVTQMLSDLEDSHATLRSGNNKLQERLGYNFAPFHTKFIESQLVVDALFEDDKSALSGLNVGDIITHINGRSVGDIVKSEHELYPASNQAASLRSIAYNILRSTSNSALLTITRDGKSMEKTVQLFSGRDIKGLYFTNPKEPSNTAFRILNDNIAYVTLQNIKADQLDSIIEKIKGTKGLIIDIRNYPSTNIIPKLVPFLSSESRPFVKFTRGNIDYPGEFTLGAASNITKTESPYKGKVIVLVNELTQSHAEFVTMALQATDNATVIGNTTAGADGNVSKILLPGGLGTQITGIGVYYPDGRETQRLGIAIDIEFSPTIEGIKNAKDELILKAVEEINKHDYQTTL